MNCYRIHSADESPATVLDASRPDGWVASDEDYATQPHGVSACTSLDDLASYVRHYSMAIRPGDVVLRLSGHTVASDRDQGAVRVDVASYEVLWGAQAWLRAHSLVEDVRWYIGEGDSVDAALADMDEELTGEERDILDALLK